MNVSLSRILWARGPAAGGSTITITGANFGQYKSDPNAGMCVMFAWSNRPLDAAPPACSGDGESYPGEFGAVAPTSWSDSAITVTVPPGIGVRDILVSVGFQVRTLCP